MIPVDPDAGAVVTQIILGSTGAFLIATCSGIAALVRNLYIRIDRLEKDAVGVGHQLRGVKQGMTAVQVLTEKRHRENHEDREKDRQENREGLTELREFLVSEFRSVGQRIDQLLRK